MSKHLLHYTTSGKGKPTIFLHGFMESTTMWDGLVMPSEMHAVFIDLPGHGQSDIADHACDSMIQMAQKVEDVVNHLDLEEFNVVGHSMGGYVALELKKLHSGCKRVMLLNSNFWPDSKEKKQDRLRVAEIARKNHRLFVREAIPGLFSDPVRFNNEVEKLVNEAFEMEGEAIALGAVAMRNRLDNEGLIQDHPIDFFIVQGKEDTVCPLELMRGKLKNKSVDYREIEGVGHMAHAVAPGIVEDLIAEL